LGISSRGALLPAVPISVCPTGAQTPFSLTVENIFIYHKSPAILVCTLSHRATPPGVGDTKAPSHDLLYRRSTSWLSSSGLAEKNTAAFFVEKSYLVLYSSGEHLLFHILKLLSSKKLATVDYYSRYYPH